MQSQASTFKDLIDAEYFVAETINKNQERIQTWLKATKTRKEHFECSFTRSTGNLMTDTEDSLQEVYGVRVVLRPTEETQEGWTVLTAYPVKPDKMKVKDRYPMISCLFGAYFTQDWHEDYDNAEALLNDFIDNASEDEIRTIINEFEILLKEKHSKEEWYQLISESFGCAYPLRQIKIEPVGWIKDILKHMIKNLEGHRGSWFFEQSWLLER